MRLHRFFIEEKIPEGGEFSIGDENLLNQWRNVLRMSAGGNVILFDGSGDEVLCEIVSLSKKSGVVKPVERKKVAPLSREVTLCLALIKKDNFELVLEKATELGVSSVVPVEADRSEKKGVNYERANKIVREAAEQSGRATVPKISEIISVDEISGDSVIVFDPRGNLSAKEFFKENATNPVSVIIGPEGGFTDSEIELFRKKNFPIVSTGTQVLRAETAAIVALTLALVR